MQIFRLNHWLKRLFVSIVIAIIGLLSISGGVALAHNSISDSSPAEGEVLASPPTQWTITFAKSVPLESASGQVVTDTGQRQDLAKPRIGTTDNVIVFDLPQNLTGTITGRWRLVGTDGHVISGRVTFTAPQATTGALTVTTSAPNVIPAAPAPAVAANIPSLETEDASISETIRVSTRFITYVAIILLGGLLFANFYIAQGVLSTPRGRLLTHIATIGTLVTPIISLWILLDDVRGSDGSIGSALSTVRSLSVGPMIMFRIVAGAAIVFFTRSLLKRKTFDDSGTRLLALLLTMYCVALAYGGHSRSLASPWLGVPTDVIHVVAVSVWLGGLAAVVVVIVPAVSVEQSMIAFDRFGFAAERAVPAIMVTGVIQSLRLHENVWSVFSSTHGLLLLAKVSVVVIMLLLGNCNRKFLARRRNSQNHHSKISRATLMRASIYEALFGAATIGITAVLVAVSPA
jgi:copper transport protein